MIVKSILYKICREYSLMLKHKSFLFREIEKFMSIRISFIFPGNRESGTLYNFTNHYFVYCNQPTTDIRSP